MTTYCYPYNRGVGWRSQEFRSHPESPYNPAGGHTGFDQAMPAGTPIYSPCDGIIRNSSWLSENYLENPWWLTQFGGDTLVIDAMDANGSTATEPTFIIAHLSDSTAPVGKRVKKGEQVGLSGNSGTATTGPHAHIEALPPNWDWNNGVYGRVDPESYFTEWPGEITVQSSSTIISKPVLDQEFTVAEAERIIAILTENQVRITAAREAAKQAVAISTENQKRITALSGLVSKALATPDLTAEQIAEAVKGALASGVEFNATVAVNGVVK